MDIRSTSRLVPIVLVTLTLLVFSGCGQKDETAGTSPPEPSLNSLD